MTLHQQLRMKNRYDLRFLQVALCLITTMLFACDSTMTNMGSGSKYESADADKNHLDTRISLDFEESNKKSDDAIAVPNNVSGSYASKCQVASVSFEQQAAKILTCALVDQVTGEKVDQVKADWQLIPAPQVGEIFFSESLSENSSWHVQYILSLKFYDEKFQYVGVTVNEQVLPIYPKENVVQIPAPYSSPSNTSIWDVTASINHQTVPASEHGGSIDWDRVYYDPLSKLYFTNPLASNRRFGTAEESCGRLTNIATTWPESWRLAIRSEISMLIANQVDALPRFSDTFWTGERAGIFDSRVYGTSIARNWTVEYSATLSNLAYFCVNGLQP